MNSRAAMRIAIRVAIPLVPIALIIFGFYLWTLYGQLKTAFSTTEQFLPTRIYSDVTRIAPPQTRAQIEERLKALAYTADASPNALSFTLHTREGALPYPTYLIPANHPMLDAGEAPITLHFGQPDPKAPLQSIEIQGKTIPDLYLEPELMATLSRNGGPDTKREIRSLLRWDHTPSLIPKAIMAIEDQHFLEHAGFDPRGLARAIFVNIKTLSFAQGGSTLTQQLVKNLMERHSKNIFRKVNELFLSILLEATFKKEQIFERYLNEVYLGQVGSLEVHGVAEGAELFFGKKVDELNLAEVALMAGLIRGPAYYSPYKYRERAMERQRLVLKKMVETEMIAEDEAEEAYKMPIRLAPPQTVATRAPFFTDFVKAELIRQLKMPEDQIPQAGFRVYTTLDPVLNQAGQHAVSDGITALETRLKVSAPDRLEGALASVDQSNGFIRALIGGRSYGQSSFNRILNMKRQVGSTFKPIVYLDAIWSGQDANGIVYGPGHPAEDAPWTLTFDHGKQSWSPKNYEKENMGWINYRTALAHSVNTVAARLGYELGIPGVMKMAKALGIESELPEVPSLSLGVAELSPIELLRVYETIANHGVQEELTAIRYVAHENGTLFRNFVSRTRAIVEAGPADLLTDMLQSVFTEGTAKIAPQLGMDRPAAGKTGTTSHHRDAWFAGYTPELTTVVWVGMDQSPTDSEKDADGVSEKPAKIALTGANSALPIWVTFMKKAHEGIPPTPFAPSAALSEVQIDRRSGKLALPNCPLDQVVTEKYVKGHEPTSAGCADEWPVSTPETVAK